MRIEYSQVLNGVIATLKVVIGMESMEGKISRQMTQDLVGAALAGLEQVAAGLDEDFGSPGEGAEEVP